MDDITFEGLTGALAHPSLELPRGTRLVIPERPNPFVPPTFIPEGPSPFAPPASGAARAPATAAQGGVEVLFIQASAAVGKSAVAAALSADLKIPLLDLARVPVSTGSLKALLLDLPQDRPLDRFHRGELPVIIDALDEGRLLSGEAGFESFLTTTAELLAEKRHTTDRPKLLFFGRYESIELVDLGLKLAAANIRSSRMEVGFFDKDGAWELITAYADLIAKPGAAYRQHPEPVRRVIGAYFGAIESALGLLEVGLWSSARGRAFAGYAPVLAALGALLAQTDNFEDLANRLRNSGASEAWGVIESVISAILVREQAKLCDQLRPQASAALPAGTYDPDEQLTLLLQYAHSQPLNGSGRVRTNAQDQNKYQSMVETQIPEHPFVRQREFRNEVLGSIVYAYAILNSLLANTRANGVASLSRHPFLWRSFSSRAADGSLIDGSDLGYALNSFWNDPLNDHAKVRIRSDPDGELVNVAVQKQNSVPQRAFTAMLPITLYAQLRDCDLDVVGTTKLAGQASGSSPSVFYVRGKGVIITSNMEVAADAVRYDGEVWFEADEISSPPRLSVYVASGSRVGWGGRLANTYPWNTQRPDLPAPYYLAGDDPLTELVEELSQRVPSGGVLILNPDLSPLEDNASQRWARRRFASELPHLLQIMVSHKLAASELFHPSGAAKVRVRFNVALGDVLRELGRPGGPTRWHGFVRDARRAFGS